MNGFMQRVKLSAVTEGDIGTLRHILSRDGRICSYCGIFLTLRTGTRDHVIPKSRSGGNRGDNLVACCSTCNNWKGSRTPIEWLIDQREYDRTRKWLNSQKRSSHTLRDIAVLTSAD